MCDYIYLDGLNATLDNNILSWDIDERYLTKKNLIKKCLLRFNK